MAIDFLPFKLSELAIIANGLFRSPELIIEVSSPSNRKLHGKADIYVEHGAEQVWIVYPATKTVSVVTSEGTAEARIGETLEFHGVTIPVDSIFPEA